MVCKNIEDVFDNTSIELLRVSIGSENRTFCKCGEVIGKSVYECPKCKAKGSSWVSVDSSYSAYTRELYSKYEVISTPDGFQINKRGYHLEANSKTKELEVKEKYNKTVAEKDDLGMDFFLKDYELRTFLSDLGDFDFEELKKNDADFSTDYENFDFDSFFDVLTYWNGSRDSDSDSVKYCLYLYLKKQVPWMFDKKEIYPPLLALYFGNLLNLKNFGDIDSFINEFHLWHFKDFLKCSWFYQQSYGTSSMFSKRASDFFNNLPPAYIDLFSYYAEHYRLKYYQLTSIAAELTDAINQFNISKKDEIFIKYLKENLISCKEKIVESYLRDLQWLKTLKLGKTYENLRNINFLRNAETLKEKGYPERKIGVFMDSFYDNPLKASYYLKSKKDLTKKEIEAFIEEQTK